ncbi:MAG: MFS transporter [Nanoarchaeota archaeon]
MKKELKILLLAFCFSSFAFSMLSPIYAIFVEEIGGGILEASYAIAIFTFSSGVLIYLVSRLEDKVKHLEYLLSLGYLVNAIAFLSYVFVSKPVHLYFVEILFGIGIAVLSPVFDGLYSKNLDKGKYVSEWGDWEALGYLIGSLSALSGGFLTAKFGFKTLFLVMFFLSLVAFLISLTLIPSSRKDIKLAKLKK